MLPRLLAGFVRLAQLLIMGVVLALIAALGLWRIYRRYRNT